MDHGCDPRYHVVGATINARNGERLLLPENGRSQRSLTMGRTKQHISRDIRRSTVGLCVLLVILMATAGPAHAQTFAVLHTFTGGADGANPVAGLTLDRGNLYGTAAGGGLSRDGSSHGTVFRMQLHGSSWIFTPLYNFSGGDGNSPQGRVTVGPDGSLYGTTAAAAHNGCSCGNVFNLKPPPTRPASPLTPWIETTVYYFDYFAGDGNNPTGDIVFDAAGNLFGTTTTGGNDQLCLGSGCGTVYELTRSGQNWSANFIYAFTEVAYNPLSGVTRDPSGNLYFTASQGNIAHGAVLALTPAGAGWTPNTRTPLLARAPATRSRD